MPLWLQINPAWRSEILALESQTSSEIFKALRVHGLRHKLSESSYAGGEIVTEYEDYMEDDPEFEEGRATEHRVRFVVRENLPHAREQLLGHPANLFVVFRRHHTAPVDGLNFIFFGLDGSPALPL